MARPAAKGEAFAALIREAFPTFDIQSWTRLHTLDGKVARHFVVKDQRVTSKRGPATEPAFSLGFKDAAYGFATMTAKNKQLAFMQGIQNKDIQIQGNPALVMWFQGLTKYLKPKKKK